MRPLENLRVYGAAVLKCAATVFVFTKRGLIFFYDAKRDFHARLLALLFGFGSKYPLFQSAILLIIFLDMENNPGRDCSLARSNLNKVK